MPDHSQWVTQLLLILDQTGSQGQDAARYIRERRIRLGLHAQPTGARWRLGGRIELHPRYAKGASPSLYAQSLIIHEVCHLRQGFLTALSVYGELRAWQTQFGFLRTRTACYHELAQQDDIIQDLMSLSLGWNRTALRSARSSMRAYAGKLYRVDLLPLYPLHLEILWVLSHTKPANERKK